MRDHESDACDCPACMPVCERTGMRCFITCDRCLDNIEADEFGPLKSMTVRIPPPLNRG